MKNNRKEVEYSAQMMGAIGSLFDEESEFFIDIKELQEGDNMTHFIQALANIVPTNFYNKFTNSDLNMLAFNHIANQLCFQYSIKSDEEKGSK